MHCVCTKEKGGRIVKMNEQCSLYTTFQRSIFLDIVEETLEVFMDGLFSVWWWLFKMFRQLEYGLAKMPPQQFGFELGIFHSML